MRRYNFILWIFSINILSYTQGLPVEQDKLLIDADIQLTPEQNEFLNGNNVARSFDPIKFWPNSTLVYSFEGKLSETEIQFIMKAMDTISSKTCVRFREANNPKEPQVIIQAKAEGCYSMIGYHGYHQILNLNRTAGCFQSGIIQHQLLHALGLVHMQNHSDRDEYVNINYENVMPDERNQFEVHFDPWDYYLGYDYESIMHSAADYLSMNGKPTIVPKREGVEIGQRTGLSTGDIDKLREIYCY